QQQQQQQQIEHHPGRWHHQERACPLAGRQIDQIFNSGAIISNCRYNINDFLVTSRHAMPPLVENLAIDFVVLDAMKKMGDTRKKEHYKYEAGERDVRASRDKRDGGVRNENRHGLRLKVAGRLFTKDLIMED
ncbi:hypothetical protein CI238_07375, partial [Colletotrichum incanum]